MTRSPSLGRRELIALALSAVAIAIVMHGPLVLHLGRDVPKDLGDPLAQAWQVAWDGHALLHQPWALFQSNQFWPLHDTLAFSDALVGYAPVGAIGSGPHAAIARYGVLYLFAYAFAFAGAYLLARELGASRLAAAAGGAAFAFAPWRMEQAGHLHVISSGGIALSVFLLVRGWRASAPGLLFAGWAVAAWQLSLGWTLGLQLAYLLAVLVAIVVWRWARSSPRPPVPRRALRAVAAGMALFALTGAVLARPYLRVADAYPEAHRSAQVVADYSAGPRMFVAAPRDSLVWAAATAGVRSHLGAIAEQTLFPGLMITVLALAGVLGGPFPRGLRRALAAGTLATAALAYGFPSAGHRWLYPYGWLYDLAPGWDAVRVPTRLWTLTTLGLALLAAGGAQRVAAALSGGRPRRHAIVALGLVALVLVEGSAFGINRGTLLAAPPHPRAPREPVGLRGLPAPVLELPMAAADNRRYLLWSTAGFPDLVNGRSSLNPSSFLDLAPRIAGFPDPTSVGLLRRMGVRTVVIHAARVRGTPWADWRSRPVAGLGLRRRLRGEVVRFALDAG